MRSDSLVRIHYSSAAHCMLESRIDGVSIWRSVHLALLHLSDSHLCCLSKLGVLFVQRGFCLLLIRRCAIVNRVIGLNFLGRELGLRGRRRRLLLNLNVQMSYVVIVSRERLLKNNLGFQKHKLLKGDPESRVMPQSIFKVLSRLLDLTFPFIDEP